MFIGGGIGGVWNTDQEEALFYRGYGKTKLDPRALTYYRFERILEDIGPFAEHLFSREASNPDDLGILQGTAGFFQPKAVVEMAYRAEKSLPSALRSATDR